MLTRIKHYTFNLGAIAITLGAAVSPSFAQTTSVPITGGSFTVNVTGLATNNVNSTAVTVLTPVGTAQVSALSGTTAGTTNLATGNNFDIAGKSTGSVNFDTGTTANFTNADTTIKGKIVTTSASGDVSALATPATVTGSIQTGSSIQVPTANISAVPANTVIIPITSGTFDVTRFPDGTTVGNSLPTVLTPYGTAQLTKFTYQTLDNLNGATAPDPLFVVGDQVRATGLASGSIPTKVSTFTDAKTALVGTLTTATNNSNVSYTLKGDITSGNLIVPASSATTIPNTSTETILILVKNPKLLKLVGLNPKFLDSKKSKFLLVLVNNQTLLNYVESKSSQVGDSDPVSLGNSNAVDKLVFVNFGKKNLYYFSEVSYQALLTAIAAKSTSTTTTTTTTTNTQTQVTKVVFVGMPSRLFPGFGTVAKLEKRDRRGDDD